MKQIAQIFLEGESTTLTSLLLMEQHRVWLSVQPVISLFGVSMLFMAVMDLQLLEDQNCYAIFFLLFLKLWTKTAIVLTPKMEFGS